MAALSISRESLPNLGRSVWPVCIREEREGEERGYGKFQYSIWERGERGGCHFQLPLRPILKVRESGLWMGKEGERGDRIGDIPCS